MVGLILMLSGVLSTPLSFHSLETHIPGHDFAVFNNACLIHHGFGVKEGFHSSKDDEIACNKELFRTNCTTNYH